MNCRLINPRRYFKSLIIYLVNWLWHWGRYYRIYCSQLTVHLDGKCPQRKQDSSPTFLIKMLGTQDFPSGALDGNPPANGDMDSILSLGIFHMLCSNQSPWATTTELTLPRDGEQQLPVLVPGVCALNKWEVTAMRSSCTARKNRHLLAATLRKHSRSSEDPAIARNKF